MSNPIIQKCRTIRRDILMAPFTHPDLPLELMEYRDNYILSLIVPPRKQNEEQIDILTNLWDELTRTEKVLIDARKEYDPTQFEYYSELTTEIEEMQQLMVEHLLLYRPSLFDSEEAIDWLKKRYRHCPEDQIPSVIIQHLWKKDPASRKDYSESTKDSIVVDFAYLYCIIYDLKPRIFPWNLDPSAKAELMKTHLNRVKIEHPKLLDGIKGDIGNLARQIKKYQSIRNRTGCSEVIPKDLKLNPRRARTNFNRYERLLKKINDVPREIISYDDVYKAIKEEQKKVNDWIEKNGGY